MSESPRNYEERIEWFQDAGLGMFVHFGLYSVLGRGEWAQWREDIHPLEYAKLAKKFNPKKFDAAALAQLAKDGGAKYVVFGTRHHDGFSLWDSKVSDFTSAKTAARRDFVTEYVKAVRKAGLKVGLYYSPMDWSWPVFNMKLPQANPLAWQEFVEKGPKYDALAWARMRDYAHEQVRELMTNYGKIDLLWYDGCWYQTAEEWKSKELNVMVRKLQPHIVINNRAGIVEDYDTPENELPLNINPQQRPWEACFCMNDTWGYMPGDINYKTPRQCLYTLLRVRTAGGNFLLNVSPKADGSMPRQCSMIFETVGAWLKRNGESVYGCGLAEMSSHGTGFFAQPGIMTCNPHRNSIYYHILRWLGGSEHCAKIDAKIISAKLLCNGQKVKYKQVGRMVYFSDLPRKAPDNLDTVIKLRYDPATVNSAWAKTFV